MDDYPTCIDALTHIGYAGPDCKKSQNEDRLFWGEQIFAVIDGVTAITPLTKNGLNAASYAASYLSAFLQAQDASDESMGGILLRANEDFGAHLQKEWPEMWALGKRGSGAVVAAMKIHKNQNIISFAGVGDCTVVATTEKGTTCLIKPDESILGLELPLIQLIDEKMQSGLSMTEARCEPDVKRLIESNRDERNKTYGVVSGEQDMKHFLKAGTISMTDLKTIALFSDGLIWPESESWEDGLLKTAHFMTTEGVYNYHKRLKYVFDQDDTCQKYKRLKHMDDATGIAISF